MTWQNQVKEGIILLSTLIFTIFSSKVTGAQNLNDLEINLERLTNFILSKELLYINAQRPFNNADKNICVIILKNK